MTSYDTYGNVYGDGIPIGWGIGTTDTSLPITLTNGNTLNITPSTANTMWLANTPTTNWLNGPYNLTLDPDATTLTPQTLDSLFERMITTVKPGEKVIVCVDKDLTSEQVREVADGLTDRGFDGIVLRGARAGTGFAGNPQNMTREETRVDILARILELWQQRPELKLTSLLEWYHGEEMNDEDFATAIETHFLKVTNGVRGKS